MTELAVIFTKVYGDADSITHEWCLLDTELKRVKAEVFIPPDPDHPFVTLKEFFDDHAYDSHTCGLALAPGYVHRRKKATTGTVYFGETFHESRNHLWLCGLPRNEVEDAEGVVQTRQGVWVPFKLGDAIIDSKGCLIWPDQTWIPIRTADLPLMAIAQKFIKSIEP